MFIFCSLSSMRRTHVGNPTYYLPLANHRPESIRFLQSYAHPKTRERACSGNEIGSFLAGGNWKVPATEVEVCLLWPRIPFLKISQSQLYPRKLWGLTFDLEGWVVKSFKTFNLEHFISSFVRIHILNRLSERAERYICYTYTSCCELFATQRHGQCSKVYFVQVLIHFYRIIWLSK